MRGIRRDIKRNIVAMNPFLIQRVKNEIRTMGGSVRSRGTDHKTALIISFLYKGRYPCAKRGVETR